MIEPRLMSIFVFQFRLIKKSKHRVVAIRGFDVNGDGNEELVTGWSSGKVDARVPSTGEVVFRIQLNAAVAGLVRADYRRTGRPDLVAVSVTGEGE